MDLVALQTSSMLLSFYERKPGSSGSKKKGGEIMRIWISARASRLNEQDHVDFEALGRQAIANGNDESYGDAYLGFIYHAHFNGVDVYITTQGEDEDNV